MTVPPGQAGLDQVAAVAKCSMPCWQPVWLHGDVMAGNVLLQLGEAAGQPEAASGPSCSGDTPGLGSVALIDFADAGIGDPLFDFVALFLSVFECNLGLLQTAIRSYGCSRPGALCGCSEQGMVDAAEVDGSGSCGALDSSEGMGSCVSRRFLAYLLLHPEGFVEKLLDTHPDVRGLGSLSEVQQHLFGWLEQHAWGL